MKKRGISLIFIFLGLILSIYNFYPEMTGNAISNRINFSIISTIGIALLLVGLLFFLKGEPTVEDILMYARREDRKNKGKAENFRNDILRELKAITKAGAITVSNSAQDSIRGAKKNISHAVKTVKQAKIYEDINPKAKRGKKGETPNFYDFFERTTKNSNAFEKLEKEATKHGATKKQYFEYEKKKEKIEKLSKKLKDLGEINTEDKYEKAQKILNKYGKITGARTQDLFEDMLKQMQDYGNVKYKKEREQLFEYASHLDFIDPEKEPWIFSLNNEQLKEYLARRTSSHRNQEKENQREEEEKNREEKIGTEIIPYTGPRQEENDDDIIDVGQSESYKEISSKNKIKTQITKNRGGYDVKITGYGLYKDNPGDQAEIYVKAKNLGDAKKLEKVILGRTRYQTWRPSEEDPIGVVNRLKEISEKYNPDKEQS